MAKISRIPADPLVGDPIELTLFELGQMVVEGLGAYCRSADAQPSISHITVDERIDEHDANTLRQWLLPSVQRLWHESADPNGRSAISPDVTLKLWALAKPYIASDFILFDEAQDSDGVMLSVLERQRHAQIIYVGDPTNRSTNGEAPSMRWRKYRRPSAP